MSTPAGSRPVRRAAIGSAVFFVLAPGVVSGLVPWLLTSLHAAPKMGYAVPLRVLGSAMILAGAAVLADSFIRFVRKGGTPNPVAPTSQLVITGLYRHVRNPMYVAVLTVILGQALVLGRLVLLAYAAGVWCLFALFVQFYEQPTLERQFGEQYVTYRQNVRAWLPRMRPR